MKYKYKYKHELNVVILRRGCGAHNVFSHFEHHLCLFGLVYHMSLEVQKGLLESIIGQSVDHWVYSLIRCVLDYQMYWMYWIIRCRSSSGNLQPTGHPQKPTRWQGFTKQEYNSIVNETFDFYEQIIFKMLEYLKVLLLTTVSPPAITAPQRPYVP